MKDRFVIASCTGAVCDDRMADRLRLLLLGASGRLGGTLADLYAERHEVLAPSRRDLDLGQPGTLAAKLRALDFDCVINTAALTNLETCEAEPGLAMRINAESSGILAQVCAERGARCIHISTDYVFDGNGCVFLNESAPAQPVNAYGWSKLAGELAVLSACPQAVVARVSWLFGPKQADVPATAIQRARQGDPLGFIEDKWSVPSYTVDIAHWLERLFTDKADVSGILHLCNTGVATWRDYAQVALELAHKHGLLEQTYATHGLKVKDFPQFKAVRPPFTVMSNNRLAFLFGETPRRWQDALEAHIESLARL